MNIIDIIENEDNYMIGAEIWNKEALMEIDEKQIKEILKSMAVSTDDLKWQFCG